MAAASDAGPSCSRRSSRSSASSAAPPLIDAGADDFEEDLPGTQGLDGPTPDWPLSRSEKKTRIMRLYEQDVQAANELIRNGETALGALHQELRRIRNSTSSEASSRDGDSDPCAGTPPAPSSPTSGSRSSTPPRFSTPPRRRPPLAIADAPEEEVRTLAVVKASSAGSDAAERLRRKISEAQEALDLLLGKAALEQQQEEDDEDDARSAQRLRAKSEDLRHRSPRPSILRDPRKRRVSRSGDPLRVNFADGSSSPSQPAVPEPTLRSRSCSMESRSKEPCNAIVPLAQSPTAKRRGEADDLDDALLHSSRSNAAWSDRGEPEPAPESEAFTPERLVFAPAQLSPQPRWQPRSEPLQAAAGATALSAALARWEPPKPQHLTQQHQQQQLQRPSATPRARTEAQLQLQQQQLQPKARSLSRQADSSASRSVLATVGSPAPRSLVVESPAPRSLMVASELSPEAAACWPQPRRSRTDSGSSGMWAGRSRSAQSIGSPSVTSFSASSSGLLALEDGRSVSRGRRGSAQVTMAPPTASPPAPANVMDFI
eukprot:TRINITY_DN1728_c0_g1_i1.p1 TRINITY_DN1728_c0_g1~~TRINITY_DN1728_c0_g1_i1.p1  ORF type:complete len:570 (-),score=133.89 TRINITY_DN1728_c0_g1_i1:45-1679(-)